MQSNFSEERSEVFLSKNRDEPEKKCKASHKVLAMDPTHSTQFSDWEWDGEDAEDTDAQDHDIEDDSELVHFGEFDSFVGFPNTTAVEALRAELKSSHLEMQWLISMPLDGF
ncbi:hypothetical protein J5N97_024787 [Dioscorea zingiberensis]|uniref:Uncharacterized protein n=1 Tax=Dioscorea zingiberensis TaxID=325984 RepID=A0A9D5C818_9LILI|nr:hypothetical protein J5N97_024787 [Dioscorea zingiberensis]